jgi:hypothetical protein
MCHWGVSYCVTNEIVCGEQASKRREGNVEVNKKMKMEIIFFPFSHIRF